MNEILKNDMIGNGTYRLVIKAPRVAMTAKAGQFVILRLDEEGERVPFTIANANDTDGTIEIIIQSVGETSTILQSLIPGDNIADLLGPLGNPSHIEHYGRVLLVCGGYGAATLKMMVRDLFASQNELSIIVGAKSEGLIIFDDSIKKFCNSVEFCTDDGSLGFHGSVIPLLENAIRDGEKKPHCIFAIGPLAMMKAVSDITKDYGIKTYVSLNPIMMDGAGLCGGCRVVVDGKIRFACVDGPEFDAHHVDFVDLINRNKMYKSFENRDNCLLYRKENK
ncbi:MAG: sulfide/dihydroorotate dehydrogenase-like FAD/NAD-binding protein [Candidatus Sumerlaeales bacterium]|nr:sulfide/dihydroorotate dehydrogenase-like FAD/NAD-binding protein [Candidatus Sumerlaeales bacterium]